MGEGDYTGRENMREAGFEPTTSASGGQRSIQLSYSRRSTAEKREACRPAGAVASFLMRTPKVSIPPHLNKDSSATLSCQLDSVRRVREAVRSALVLHRAQRREPTRSLLDKNSGAPSR